MGWCMVILFSQVEVDQIKFIVVECRVALLVQHNQLLQKRLKNIDRFLVILSSISVEVDITNIVSSASAS